MRIALAGFLHETNTFSPTPADLAAFQQGGGHIPLARGLEIDQRAAGLNVGIAGALDEAAQRGWETISVIWAGAIPSAPVTRDAFETILGELIAGLEAAGPLDGVYLDLHGAMVAEHYQDGEAEIAHRVRQTVGEGVPIVASLDLHGNLSERFARIVDGLVGFRTYPHIDMAKTGRRALELMAAIMRTDDRPAMAFRRLPYLVPIPFQTTEIEPAKTLYATLDDVERDGALSASLFMGFPAADITDCGPTAVAFADKQDDADRAVDSIADAYLLAEDAFQLPVFKADEAVKEAMQRSAKLSGPVVIADAQDNPGAGGVSATTHLLRALIAAKADEAALGLIVDPTSAAQAHAVGRGNSAIFKIGSHPGLFDDEPVEVAAIVEELHDGAVQAPGPYYGGTCLALGPSACLRIAGIRVIVTSTIAQMADREMFRFLGVEPEQQKLLVVKSSAHFRADFAPIATDILIAEAPGPAPMYPSELPFTQLRADLRLYPGGPTFEDWREHKTSTASVKALANNRTDHATRRAYS
ncbi:MAG: M81 family metallopeptidase [Pseudomonadota bacterium]